MNDKTLKPIFTLISNTKTSKDDSELKNTTEFLDARSFLDSQEFESLDDLKSKLKTFAEKKNATPIPEFLGLSSGQMHTIHTNLFSFENPFFNLTLSKDQIPSIPLVKEAWFFLTKIHSQKFLKATQKGKLPRAFVQEFYREFYEGEEYPFLPINEDDHWQSTQMKDLLLLSAYIKKHAGKYSLTKEGESILKDENLSLLFLKISWVFMNRWNWAYGDNLSDFRLIQQSAIFNFLLLDYFAKDWKNAFEIGQIFEKAFPTLSKESYVPFMSPREEVARAFALRFIKRVCLPLGLVEIKTEQSKDPFTEIEWVKTTQLFNESFLLKIKTTYIL